ncbi:MAG: hypothetical protein KDA86_15925 [Planctomycetaceae bacterium]|nr:hypothetical protein [Planctomycetaceae bacterium]
MTDLPFPSPTTTRTVPSIGNVTSIELPWQRVGPHEPPLLMFQVRFADGRMISFAYSDLREIRRRDAGHLTIGIYGMKKYEVTIEGRNLDELHSLLAMANIKSLTEFGPRSFDRPEESPCIDRIRIETITRSASP